LRPGRVSSAPAALDPLSGLTVGWYGVTTALQGDVQAGEALLREAHGLGWLGPARFSLLKLALADGPGEEAARRFQDWVREDPRIPEAMRPVHLSAEPGFRDAAARDSAVRALEAAATSAPDYSWASVLLMLGAHEEALDEALSDKDQSGWIFLLNIWYPQDQAFREQPGFMALAERSGLVEFWRVHGEPDHCRLLEAPVRRLECDQVSLFAELKRRNVFRVGIFYVVAAWLVVEVAETVLPLFDVPAGVLRGLIVLLVIGFVPALVFSWIYELTPEGLKRDVGASPNPDFNAATGHKLNVATIVAAALAIGVIALDRLLPQRAVVQPAAGNRGQRRFFRSRGKSVSDPGFEVRRRAALRQYEPGPG
jgi:hypothetical protein